MAGRRSPSDSASRRTVAAEPLPLDQPSPMAEWLAQASAQGVQPEQALALIGLGLFQRLRGAGEDPSWVWSEAEDGGSADLNGLRQRLELTRLAIQTGAPLTTAEVAVLLGARPGRSMVERGGLRARRLSRNVWTLSRAGDGAGNADDAAGNGIARDFGGGFSNGFRRRL